MLWILSFRKKRRSVFTVCREHEAVTARAEDDKHPTRVMTVIRDCKATGQLRIRFGDINDRFRLFVSFHDLHLSKEFGTVIRDRHRMLIMSGK